MNRDTLAIVIPVFNDWASLQHVVGDLAAALAGSDINTHLVIVDDGSTEIDHRLADVLATTPFTASILTLARNVGHQSAIAFGLCHAVTALSCDIIAIMDADGEDRPADLPSLLAVYRANRHAIIVADRRKRSEGTGFVLFYHLYKRMFALLTGTPISFGNFSVMGVAIARRLINMHELLLHIAATMIRSRYPIIKVATDRGDRYADRSKMSFISLVIHGLSSIAVFSERTFTRILVLSSTLFLAIGGAATLAILLKLAGMATPGWVTSVIGLLLMVLMQNVAVALGGLVVVLNNKRDFTILPWKIAPTFIAGITHFPSTATPAP